jgi:competence protein ComEA
MRRVLVSLGLLALTVLSMPAAASSRAPTQVDLNVATVEQLDALPGLGRKRAEAILEFRQKRPFRRVTELLRIRGIGPRLFVRLKPYVQVVDVSQLAAPPP